jgi:hypothetical protein
VEKAVAAPATEEKVVDFGDDDDDDDSEVVDFGSEK